MQLYTESRRPSERTEQFFQDYLEKQNRQPGDRLPSPRQIAAELGVSESTVRGVVRKWLQKGKLRSRQGSGIFISQTRPVSGALRIGANVRSEAVGKHWGSVIHLGVLQAMMELGPKGLFTSLYSSSEEIDALPEAEVLSRCRDLDGVIIYQSDPHIPQIAAYCRENRKPFVYLNPPGDEVTSNYVAASNLVPFYRLTRALRDCGRKRFAALINPELERSVSVRQKLSGLINGIGPELGQSVELRIFPCKGFFEEHGYLAIKELLGNGTFRPDAILCAGDGLALGAMAALKEHGVAVPEQASVISGAGFDAQVHECQMTTLVQPVQEIGRHLVSMLVGMIDRKLLEVPARILPVGIRTGQTTTAEESRRLDTAFSG